ncbi:glycoside hydrolase [Nocardia sp. NPDC051570]|uniref:glycoside hydrolase n=1 Tax=Nocardia sp. NPDC051570 TaxID=3364324 RepID=UPI003790B1F9
MTSGNAGATGTPLRYTMTAFTNSSQIDMYVYQSTDGVNFTELPGAHYRPPNADLTASPNEPPPPGTTEPPGKSLCRDPSVFRHVDGTYYLTYTTGWNRDTIGFARSTDRITWNWMYDYTIPIDDVQNAWAPTWFIDGKRNVNVLLAINVGPNFQPHIMTATRQTLTQDQWRAPTPLRGITPADGTLGYIDITIKLSQNRYYAFLKNESTKNVEVATAESPEGPYTFQRTGNWAGWGGPDKDAGEPREGQCVIQLPDGRWRIYLDAYDLTDPTQGSYLYSDSVTADLLGGWTKPVPLPGVSGTVRHCTVLPEQLPAPKR